MEFAPPMLNIISETTERTAEMSYSPFETRTAA